MSYNRQYYEDHKEQYRGYARKYYHAHREVIRAKYEPHKKIYYRCIKRSEVYEMRTLKEVGELVGSSYNNVWAHIQKGTLCRGWLIEKVEK